MNNVAWQILLSAKLVWKLAAIIINVDTAFLYRDLEKEIYMQMPEGMTGFSDEVLLLLKSLYGLMQAARQWNKKFITILKIIGFKGGDADLCLLIKHSEKGLIIITAYVDDIFCVSHKEALKEFILDLEKHGLSVKVTTELKDYLSCNLAFLEDGGTTWIGQPNLIWKLEEKFGYLVKDLQTYVTPGMPGIHIV